MKQLLIVSLLVFLSMSICCANEYTNKNQPTDPVTQGYIELYNALQKLDYKPLDGFEVGTIMGVFLTAKNETEFILGLKTISKSGKFKELWCITDEATKDKLANEYFPDYWFPVFVYPKDKTFLNLSEVKLIGWFHIIDKQKNIVKFKPPK